MYLLLYFDVLHTEDAPATLADVRKSRRQASQSQSAEAGEEAAPTAYISPDRYVRTLLSISSLSNIVWVRDVRKIHICFICL